MTSSILPKIIRQTSQHQPLDDEVLFFEEDEFTQSYYNLNENSSNETRLTFIESSAAEIQSPPNSRSSVNDDVSEQQEEGTDNPQHLRYQIHSMHSALRSSRIAIFVLSFILVILICVFIGSVIVILRLHEQIRVLNALCTSTTSPQY
ncbi:unnamed protein product [Clavelina lepadiformis]|uniref:Uncharacterized protein n=1 Tax=Clavelina lepadiformis TaxID=159417 RepID=A0ABP0GFF4_CLALP